MARPTLIPSKKTSKSNNPARIVAPLLLITSNVNLNFKVPALADKYFELQERKIQAMTGQQARPKPQAAQESADEPTTIYDDYGL